LGRFFNNEKPEKTRKKFMEVAVTYWYASFLPWFFPCLFGFFVVKKSPPGGRRAEITVCVLVLYFFAG